MQSNEVDPVETCQLKVILDPSTQSVTLFQTVKSVPVSKPALFKHGVMAHEVPERIAENDFDHLQSKVPHLEGMIGEYVQIERSRIINSATGDRDSKWVSEVIGVGCGLLYSIALLGVSSRSISKVPPPKTKKKYMDFSVQTTEASVEIEMKGTAANGTLSGMLRDIDEKKQCSDAALKFGTVVIARKPSDTRDSEIVVKDDPPIGDLSISDGTLHSIIEHYLVYLSFIVDSSYYNRFVRRFFSNRLPPPIPLKKIHGKMSINGREYLGEFFDRRLTIGNITTCYRPEQNIGGLFQALTKTVGKTKYFLGIDKGLFELYNTRNREALVQYLHPLVLEARMKELVFIDSDGIAVLKSKDGANRQLEERFPEDEVKQRLTNYVNFIENHAVDCGAPCRSRDRAGKPCEIKTYRGHCHFHR